MLTAKDPTVRRCVISYHDECSAHTNDYNSRSWNHNGAGKLKEKSRGTARMVSAYCCADIGMWRNSWAFIEPGAAERKDSFWGGNDVQLQAKDHLLEFDAKFPECTCVDVYDNSTGHNCKAPDALDASSINITPGGKNYKIMRDGYYLKDEVRTVQSMYFQVGDIVYVNISIGTDVSTMDLQWKTIAAYPTLTIISSDCELVGVAKGQRQLLREQPDFAECVLKAQPDFASQKCGLVEVYEKHNAEHGTDHYCIFLPKFHPELNPIERVWSKMKWHVRRTNNGSIITLRESMEYGLSEENIPLSTIRRYCRLVACYYEAYEQGMSLVTAQKWMAQRRSHRGYAANMDERLEKIYYPNGRPPDPPAEPSVPEISTDNLSSSDLDSDEIDSFLSEMYPIF